MYYRKTFMNGTKAMTDTFYPLINVEDAASVQNGTGTLKDAVRNCED